MTVDDACSRGVPIRYFGGARVWPVVGLKDLKSKNIEVNSADTA